MNRRKEIKSQELLKKLYKKLGGEKITEEKIYEIWIEIMPENIHTKTKNILFKEGILHIYTSSNVINNELSFAKEKIINSFNEKLKNCKVLDLKFFISS